MSASAPHPGSADSLIRALPDLVVGIRRDGVILALNGGHGVPQLHPGADSVGRALPQVWPEAIAQLLHALTRKALASRASAEARFAAHGSEFEVRVSAQGPQRVIAVIRAAHAAGAPESDIPAAPRIERRGFLRRFKQWSALAALREQPLAVAVIHVEGIAEIAQTIAPGVAEQIMTAAIVRLSQQPAGAAAPGWYLGQLSDSLLALVVESCEREAIESRVRAACASLSEPLILGGDRFQLAPSAGIAILGQDAAGGRALLDHARAALNEARRGADDGAGARVCFFTNALQLRSLARLDMARELHDAISNGELGLKFVGRHDLESGRLVAWVGYLRWHHPLRGEIRPQDFLKMAETTGLGTTLSRAAMQWLLQEYRRRCGSWAEDVRISFGALRHHLAHAQFVADFEQLLADGELPPSRLELRVPGRCLDARPPGDLRSLSRAGVQLVVDEVGRGVTSLDWLARAPLHGLQLDRACVLAAHRDPVALRTCRAAIATARALDLMPIGTGIDDAARRDFCIQLGCSQGSGDLFAAPADLTPALSDTRHI
ncbi:MAG TPA: GGDEF domain-containing phosphodiesterase [Steroidobacteraceae bacterium]|nr:GGDEF domain-containing phosphodiesterase [Steroidobacteraceae bacterium]